MKIAYVYDRIYPWLIGGAEKRVWEIASRLVERGHEVHLYGMKFWDGNNVIKKEGVYIHGVCKQKEMYVKGRRSIPEALYFARKVLFPLLKEDFDVIDSQEFPYFPCFSAKFHSLFKRTPLIITWHEIWGDYWFEYLGKKGFFGWAVEKLTLKLTNSNIAVSEATRMDLLSLGIREEKIHVIPNGIDFKRIDKIRPSEEESEIIFAGRLIKEKNVDVLIKAINSIRKEIPDVKCMIIGDGPEKGILEKLANDLEMDNNIKFTGFLEDYDDVISYMKSSKVFVLPSTREGFGIVALEANACGLPVVTVNHKSNAARDFIIDGNGFVCELSEGDLAEKIFMGLDERKTMKGKCIENAKKYDWNEIVDLTENYFKAR